jgi:hypothetical protein
MINFRNSTAALALGLMVAAIATAAFAKNRALHPGHGARTQAIKDVPPEDFLSRDRAQVLRATSKDASSIANHVTA